MPNCSEWVCEPIYLSSPVSPAEEPLSSRLVSSRQPYNFALGFNPKQLMGGKIVMGLWLVCDASHSTARLFASTLTSPKRVGTRILASPIWPLIFASLLSPNTCPLAFPSALRGVPAEALECKIGNIILEFVPPKFPCRSVDMCQTTGVAAVGGNWRPHYAKA